MVLDECGFYRVDTRLSVPRGTEYSDTIVLPSQVDQCIMVPMQTLEGWSIVIPIFLRCRHGTIRGPKPDEEDDSLDS